MSLFVLALAGCSHDPSAPEKPSDDPSARTTTNYTPPTPEELSKLCDVPMYPGSKAPDGLSRMPRKDADGTHYELVLTTNDPVEKAAKFYLSYMKQPPGPGGKAPTVVGTTPHGNMAIIQVSSEGDHTVVRIKSIASGH